MFKKYFFIPANNPKFISKINNLTADFFVFDLEDAILGSEIESSINNLATISLESNHYVRFRVFESDTQLNENLFIKLIQIGFRRFLLPKFSGSDQLESIKNFLLLNSFSLDDFEFILLIESPIGLIHLHDTIKNKQLKISAIGLGSHDYVSIMGMKHNDYNLYYAKQLILNIAKAYNINALDIVCVDLKNDDSFKQEAKLSFEMGFEGKFLIHPKQLTLLDEIEFFSDDEIKEAENVYDKIIDIKNQKESVVVIEGKIYEKPHINRIIKIINWKNAKNGSK